MLSCKDITEKANSYIDQELPFFTRLKVKLHLQMCKHCQRYVDQLQLTIQALGKMRQDDKVSDDVVENVVRTMKESEQQHGK